MAIFIRLARICRCNIQYSREILNCGYFWNSPNVLSDESFGITVRTRHHLTGLRRCDSEAVGVPRDTEMVFSYSSRP